MQKILTWQSKHTAYWPGNSTIFVDFVHQIKQFKWICIFHHRFLNVTTVYARETFTAVSRNRIHNDKFFCVLPASIWLLPLQLQINADQCFCSRDEPEHLKYTVIYVTALGPKPVSVFILPDMSDLVLFIFLIMSEGVWEVCKNKILQFSM